MRSYASLRLKIAITKSVKTSSHRILVPLVLLVVWWPYSVFKFHWYNVGWDIYYIVIFICLLADKDNL